MNAYYVQKAEELFPVFGVSSIEEAKQFVDAADYSRIIETADPIYMHINTGSVDFSSNWEDFDSEVEAGNLAEVSYDAETESWQASE